MPLPMSVVIILLLLLSGLPLVAFIYITRTAQPALRLHFPATDFPFLLRFHSFAARCALIYPLTETFNCLHAHDFAVAVAMALFFAYHLRES